MSSHVAGQPDFHNLLAEVQRIATEVALVYAPSVDADSRFPQETLEALRKAKALSAPLSREIGGMACTMRQLATLCSALAQGCGSSAMILAMHYIQVACIARHSGNSVALQQYLKELAGNQYLLASMTSEVGTFGETRQSVCAVERSNGRFKLDKEATTGSYCEHADGILVTCRRAPDAPGSDQVLVLVRKGDYTLKQTTTWDTMGMRGTCSPGFRLESSGPEEQIVPGSFADSSAMTMVPYSHILWSSLWWGIAANAVALAAESVRAGARRNPEIVPPAAMRLAETSNLLQTMRHNWLALATEFDEIDASGNRQEELMSMGWALKMNNLKIHASETAPQLVHQALQIIGIMAYKNDTKFSLSRQYRDVLSAALMISNDRIEAKSASMLLVYKDQ